MLGDALVVPAARSGWKKTLFVGGSLFGVLGLGSRAVYRFVARGDSIAPDVVTLVVVVAMIAVGCAAVSLAGYHVRVLRSGLEESGLPAFRPVGELLSTGVRLCGVVVGYGVVPIVVMLLLGVVVVSYGVGTTTVALLVGDLVSSSPIEPSPQAVTTALSYVVVGVLLAVVLVAFVLVYVSVAATVRFAHTGQIRSAFAIRPVLRVAFTSDFFVGCVLWLSVALTLGVLGVALSSIIVGLFLLFYTSVAGTYALGRGYGQAIATEQ